MIERLLSRYPHDPDIRTITTDLQGLIDAQRKYERKRHERLYAEGLTARGTVPKRGKVGRPSMVERMEKNGG